VTSRRARLSQWFAVESRVDRFRLVHSVRHLYYARTATNPLDAARLPVVHNMLSLQLLLRIQRLIPPHGTHPLIDVLKTPTVRWLGPPAPSDAAVDSAVAGDFDRVVVSADEQVRGITQLIKQVRARKPQVHARAQGQASSATDTHRSDASACPLTLLDVSLCRIAERLLVFDTYGPSSAQLQSPAHSCANAAALSSFACSSRAMDTVVAQGTAQPSAPTERFTYTRSDVDTTPPHEAPTEYYPLVQRCPLLLMDFFDRELEVQRLRLTSGRESASTLKGTATALASGSSAQASTGNSSSWVRDLACVLRSVGTLLLKEGDERNGSAEC
jgi:hypothetical protein